MSEQYIDDFNTTLLDLAKQLALSCPNSIIANNYKSMEAIIRQYPTKILDQFINFVLPDKPRIDAGDADYFMNNNYNNITAGDNALIKNVFEFKTIWTQLSENNRIVVVQYMQLLCSLASEYFLITCT